MKKLLMAVAACAAALGGFAADYYHFNGTAGAVMRSVNYPSLTNFSACVWIRNAKIPTSSSDVIFAQGAISAGTGFAVYINTSGELVFQTRQTTVAALKARVPCLTANDDAWHLVGVTHDWVNKVKRIWVDGKIVATVTGSTDMPDPSSSTTSLRFCLGALRNSSGNVSLEYEGDMAEASLWDTVLTEEDFARLLKLRVDPSAEGLLGYWPLDDGEGKTCMDRSSGGHNMTADNSPGAWTADDSVVYQKGVPDALALWDANGGLSANHNYNLQTFSACVWVRNLLPSLSSAVNYLAILGEGALGDRAGWSVFLDTTASPNTITFQINQSGTTADKIATPSTFLNDGLWHAIAVTHDWANKVKRLYVDGALVGETTEIKLNPATTAHFAIGMREARAGFGRSCPGSYAHVSLWDKALTADEVKALSLQNLSGEEDGLVGYWPLDDGPVGPFADLAGSHPMNIREGTSGYSLDKVPFYEQQKVGLSVEAAGFGAFSVLARASGRTDTASAKVVWGPESAPQLHTNELGTVELPDFSSEVSHGLLPGGSYRAQVFVTTDGGTIRSAVIPFVAKGVLGSSYQEVLYIESSGTQMIDTEYLPNTKTFVEASLQFTGTWTQSGTNPYILGCAEGSKCFYLNFGGTAVQIGCRLNDTAVKTFDITAAIRTSRNDLFIDAAKGNVKWGTESGSPAAKTNVHEEYTMGLFGYNNASGEMKPFSRSHMRVYSCKIYDADGLVRDFVPCRELTGQKRAGLYDRVNKKFHPNAAGTDDFLTAADETVLYPLTVTSLAQDRRGPVDPDYGTLFVPAGADVPFAALADVGPENPKARFRGWKMSAQDDEGAWQTLGEGREKSVIIPQPASPAKFTWNWGGMGLIIVVE